MGITLNIEGTMVTADEGDTLLIKKDHWLPLVSTVTRILVESIDNDRGDNDE